jgi:hypothetical protein
MYSFLMNERELYWVAGLLRRQPHPSTDLALDRHPKGGGAEAYARRVPTAQYQTLTTNQGTFRAQGVGVACRGSNPWRLMCR